MAKRKKRTTTRSHRRRRRVGAAGGGLGNEVMEVVGLVVGNVGATIMQRQATTLNPKMISGAQIVGGFVLKKHATSPFMQGISYGLMSAGAIGLTHEVGLIHGVEEMVSGMYNGGYMVEAGDDMRGLRNDQYIGGLANESHVGDLNDLLINEM